MKMAILSIMVSEIDEDDKEKESGKEKVKRRRGERVCCDGGAEKEVGSLKIGKM